MEKPALLQAAEQALGYSFGKLLDIHAHFNDPDLYPDSYRDPNIMTWQQEMVRDGHGGTAFIDKEGRLLGLNLYSCREQLDPQRIQDLLALDLPDLLALNLNESGVTHFTFTERQPRLMYVNLSQNKSLTRLHFEATPTDLRILELYDSKVETLALPAGLDALYKLDVARNGLKELTFGGGCPKLWFLDASDNALGELGLPAGFDALQYIFLRGNQVKSFTFEGSLPSLETLDLRKNALTDLPANFLSLQGSLTHLFLSENPWAEIKDAVAPGERDNSAEAVFSLLQSLQGETDYLLEAKMILVGNGEVGKTSIRLKLNDIDAELPAKSERTPLIEIDEYVVKNLPSEVTQLAEPVDFTFNVWDFGGQGRYREVQQLFCSYNALYLFVTAYDDTPEHRLEPEDYISFEYWLDMVAAYGFDEEQKHSSPIVLVVNKTDVEYTSTEKGKYLKDFPQIHPQEIFVSCKQKRGIDQLKDTIRELIPKISPDVFSNERNVNWLAVKDELEKRKSENYLTYSAYEAICTARGLDARDARTWIRMLDRIGKVIYFGQHPGLKDWVILDPEWVRKAIYAILDSRMLAGNYGILRDYMHELIWSGYEAEERKAFIALMQAYKLCFAQTNTQGETEYVVPACLPKAEPVLPDYLQQPAFQLRIHFKPFVPAGTVNKLMVSVQQAQRGNEAAAEAAAEPVLRAAPADIRIYNNYLWKNNAIFHAIGQDAYAHVQENWDEKRIEVALFGQGNLEGIYHALFALIEQLNQELKATRYLRALGVSTKILDAGSWVELDYFLNHKKLSSFKSQDMTDLQRLLQQGYVERVFDLLEQHGQDASSLTLLRARWNRNEKDYKKNGLISKTDYDLERNRITYALDDMAGAVSIPVSMPSAPASDGRGATPLPPPVDVGRKILFLAANPSNATRLQTDKEHRMLKAEYERGEQGSQADFLAPQFAVTIGELQRALDGQPTIIHFSGHGTQDGIIITDDQNQHLLLGASPLRRIFKRMRDTTELVILNACFSAEQAQVISSFGIYVIGANREVLDEACVNFSKAFYNALGRGKDYEAAYDEAITAIGTYHPSEEAKFEAWKDGQKLNW